MKFAIVTVSYNAAATLADTLESVCRQVGVEIEHWVIDGASTDDTAEVIERHGQQLAGYVSEPDKGLYDAMNKGASLAHGEVLGFLNADDWYASHNALAWVAEAFEQGADLVYGDLVFVEPAAPFRVKRVWRDSAHEPADFFRRGWQPAHPTTFVRRELFEAVGGFDLRWPISADYAFLAAAMARRGTRLRHVPRVVVNMRLGGASTAGWRAVLKANRECASALREAGRWPWGTVGLKLLRKLPQLLDRPHEADELLWQPWAGPDVRLAASGGLQHAGSQCQSPARSCDWKQTSGPLGTAATPAPRLPPRHEAQPSQNTKPALPGSTTNFIRMSTVQSHIDRGLIVGPSTKKPLQLSSDGAWLQDAESTERYRIDRGVPILLLDEKWAASYWADSQQMMQEYQPARAPSWWRSLLTPKAYRAPPSQNAFLRIFEGLPDNAVCLSPGGGPSREHRNLTTLNIGPFPNVDVVADAHAIPYGDGTVDAVYCEAVFEHLYDPATAARELFRVLKAKRLAYVCTPFLQPYHGYPHHYQNYTITGHALLFKTAGFEVLESGADVGPVFALCTMIALFLREYVPSPISKLMRGLWAIFSVLACHADKWIAPRNNAYLLASTTYVLLRKP